MSSPSHHTHEYAITGRFALWHGSLRVEPSWGELLYKDDDFTLWADRATHAFARHIRVHVGSQGISVQRDALGRVPIMLYASKAHTVVSNAPLWLAEHCVRHPTPSSRRVDAMMAGWDRHDVGTQDFLEHCKRVLPGHTLRLTRTGTHTQRSWWAEDVRAWHDSFGHEESCEALFDLLDDALYDSASTGLAVSSGLDSTLLAARRHTHQGASFPCGSMSFPRSPRADETARTLEWASGFGLRVTHFDMSEQLPWLARDTHDPYWILGPQSHPGELYERAFISSFASQAGVYAVMTGVGADQLFEVSPRHVVMSLALNGQIAALEQEHWHATLHPWRYAGLLGRRLSHAWRRSGVLRGARDRYIRAQLMAHAPASTSQLATTLVSEWPDTEVWGESDERRLRHRVLMSWEWENLMRALWRLEHATQVRIETPYLSERLWRWGVWLSAPMRLDGFGGRLFNKFLLRKAHAHYAEQFPKGFARRGKAAVFDAHIRKGMVGARREDVLDVLEHIEDPALKAQLASHWRAVLHDGALGVELVKLCRGFAGERWLQSLERIDR